MQYKFHTMALDEEFLKCHLDYKERALFDRLGKKEQNHSISVAKGLSEIKDLENHNQLVKVGLLHDVGKSMRPLSIMEKGLFVVAHKVLKKKMKRLASFDGVASYLYHGERGAEILRRHNVFKNQPLFYDVVKTHHWSEEILIQKNRKEKFFIYHSQLKKIDDQY